MNKSWDEILAKAFFRSMSAEQRYSLQKEFRDAIAQRWGGALTSADAFYHYCSHFNRDEDDFKANMQSFAITKAAYTSWCAKPRWNPICRP